MVHVGDANSTLVVQLTTDNYDGGDGWTAAYNCGTGYQGTSSLNNTGHAIASNMAIAQTDSSGDICVRSLHPTDLIVDTIGSITGATINAPTRILDTRH